MKRRLRKKLQVGEFEPWLMAVVLHFNDESFESPVFEKWFDEFIDLIESRGLSFTGGGKHPVWSGAIGSRAARRARIDLDDYSYVSDFLGKSPAIRGFRLGPIVPASEYERLYDAGEYDTVFVEIPEEHRLELRRILAEIDSGEVEFIPAEKVLAELRAKLPTKAARQS